MSSGIKTRFLSVNNRAIGVFLVRQGLLGLLKGECFERRIVPMLFVFPRKSRWRLHSLACIAGIDAVFLDENGVVVELLEGWRPNGSFRVENCFKFLLEMPCGWIKKCDLQLGVKINGII